MAHISLIHNSGIQFYELEENLIINLEGNDRILDALYFYEYDENGKVKIAPAYYFPINRQCLKRDDLIDGGYLHEVTNEMMPEDDITEVMNWLDPQDCVRINRLTEKLGESRISGLDLIENKWLPLPYYERTLDGNCSAPTNWCRIKLYKIESESTENKRSYRVLLAFDTNARQNSIKEAPFFLGEPYRSYSLCGVNYSTIAEMSLAQQDAVLNRLIPLKAYDFCNTDEQPWLNRYLKNIFHTTDQAALPAKSKLKHLAYYSYFISYLFRLNILPEVKLYNDEGVESVDTNLILDIGNSRTFGLIAEDPIDSSFSKAALVKVRNLENGEVYTEPFDMRLCFKKEDFGISTVDGAFRWPSVVRLGKEAMLNIYGGCQNPDSPVHYDTSYSSPKRYLWDKEPYVYQWKYISSEENEFGPLRAIDYEGLMQQFHNDGQFAADPQKMGDKSCYSRSSLMTFCFLEILLQVRLQINSYEFRKANGNEHRKREIKRVILTCPTAMTKEEQITLRQCMEDASIVLKRFYAHTYNKPYDKKNDKDRMEIIPSVIDLSFDATQLDQRRSWSYDEATCCQMVYLYSELRRYLGNADEFFETYGRKRNNDTTPTLNIATLDIGAGTTDIMLCKYVSNSDHSITPEPLFWESFKLAGDDLVKRIIVDALLDSPQPDYPNASGIIAAKLQSIGVANVSEKMNHFFGDTQRMHALEKRMRKEFMIQVLQPICSALLELLRQDKPEETLSFDDFFPRNKPSKELLDFFAKQMGFRFENLTITYSPKFLNEIVRRVFEPEMRKWAALFHAYQCDVVLLSGRPCSLPQMYQIMKRLYPVSPDRLISMNNYRVGSWYPGSNDVGHFTDNKSMVAVGALIAYLAENGKLAQHFKLTTNLLKTKVLPTTDYIGLLNHQTGMRESFLTPKKNTADLSIRAFPQALGAKQIDIAGYPSNMLYSLKLNEKAIKELAQKRLLKRKPEMEGKISPDVLSDEMEKIIHDIHSATPLQITFEREYQEDKERIKITSVSDKNNNTTTITPDLLELKLQTWSEESTNWLDSGIFKLRIGK